MTAENVIPLPDPAQRREGLADAIENEWIRLIEGLSSVNEASEGTGGSDAASPAISVAERVRLLSAATEFLIKLQKLRPSKSRSGISNLNSELRGSAGSRSRRS